MLDPTKLKVARQINRPEICFGMARVPGSTRIVYGTSAGTVCELDLANEKAEPTVMTGHEGYVSGVVVAGAQAVSGAYDGKLIWWDLATHQPLRTVPAHEKWIRGLAISPDGKLIASVADDMVCHLWNAETGEKVRTLAGHAPRTPQHYPSMLFAAAFSPDGAHLATVDKIGHVIIWDVASGAQRATLDAPTMYTWDPKQRRHSIGGIRSVAFSPDGELVALGGTGQIGNIDHLEALARLEVFNWKTGERTHEFPGDKYKGLIEVLLFHPQGEWLMATGGEHGGFVKFFDLKNNKLLHHADAPMCIHAAAFSDDLETLIATGHQKVATFELKAS